MRLFWWLLTESEEGNKSCRVDKFAEARPYGDDIKQSYNLKTMLMIIQKIDSESRAGAWCDILAFIRIDDHYSHAASEMINRIEKYLQKNRPQELSISHIFSFSTEVHWIGWDCAASCHWQHVLFGSRKWDTSFPIQLNVLLNSTPSVYERRWCEGINELCDEKSG